MAVRNAAENNKLLTQVDYLPQDLLSRHMGDPFPQHVRRSTILHKHHRFL